MSSNQCPQDTDELALGNLDMAPTQEETTPLSPYADSEGSDDTLWDEKCHNEELVIQKPRTKILSTLLSWSIWTARLILPRFLTGDLPTCEERGATAYLDALRGWAAWTVFNYHHLDMLDNHPKYNFLEAGKPSVTLFFVISGYALSASFIKTSNAGILMPKLASSIFRRYLRLFLPVFCAMFLTMICILVGLAPNGSGLSPPLWSIPEALSLFSKCFLWLANPFSPVLGYHKDHDDWFGYQMWTIPVEFRGSMILFMYLAMSYRSSTFRRILLILVATPFLVYWDAIYVLQFLYGAALAMTEPTKTIGLPVTTTEKTISTTSTISFYRRHRDKLVIPLFLVAAWMYHVPLTFPRLAPQDAYFPWSYLSPYGVMDHGLRKASKSRQERDIEHAVQVIAGLASVLMIFCLQRSRYLRWPLETRIMLYLGQISFGVYLMHILVIFVVWNNNIQPWVNATVVDSWWRGYGGWIIFYVPLCLSVITMADWFERLDQVAQRVSRKVWEWYAPKS